MKILFLGTGGTIDKDYDRKSKTYNFEIANPAVKRILDLIHPNFEFSIKSILKKDSLDLTNEDRLKILEEVKRSKETKIIITHGTDSMIETAKVLSKIKDKAIIIVGSAMPERFNDSDAPINIGVAIGAINNIDSGIFIAMNGRIYDFDKVQKLQETGQFVEK